MSDYLVPKLTVLTESEYHIEVWGQRRLSHLKKRRRVLYANLLTSGQLTEHLAETAQAAHERFDRLVRDMATAQGVTEQLKAENQMLWVGRINNIYACVGEIVLNELIYN